MSCEKDESIVEINEIVFDGTVYKTNHGLILDYGVFEGTHYNNYFLITDGRLSIDGSLLSLGAESTYYLYVPIFSFGTESFKTGEFVFKSTADLVDQNIFVAPTFFLKEEEAFVGEIASGGTISISGSSSVYSINYDLTFQDKTLSGSYSGEFDIEDIN